MQQFVYFVRCRSHIKIGFTTNIHSRLCELQSGNPYPLVLLGFMPGGIAEERILHERFKAYRVRGEWFKACSAILFYIEEGFQKGAIRKGEDPNPSKDSRSFSSFVKYPAKAEANTVYFPIGSKINVFRRQAFVVGLQFEVCDAEVKYVVCLDRTEDQEAKLCFDVSYEMIAPVKKPASKLLFKVNPEEEKWRRSQIESNPDLQFGVYLFRGCQIDSFLSGYACPIRQPSCLLKAM